MTKVLTVSALTLIMSAFALSQTQGRQTPLDQTEPELIALSQKAVDAYIGKGIIEVDDAGARPPLGMMGRATVKGKFDSVELKDTRIRIGYDLAVVTGRVVFKGGLPEWRTKESSSGVTIRFAKRNARWEFVGLCMGKCAAE